MARRAGVLEMGVAAARQAVRDGRAKLIVVAADAAEGQRSKVLAIAEARGVDVRSVATAVLLGRVVGAATVSAVAVTDAGLARAAVGRTKPNRDDNAEAVPSEEAGHDEQE